MIDYDHIRGRIPVQAIMNDIERCRIILRDCEARDGFIIRSLTSEDIRSLKASVDIGLALLKKVMPDLKAEDLNTIKGRERLSFITDMQAKMNNPGIGEGERRAFQLEEVLRAIATQRISVDEGTKIAALLCQQSKPRDDGMPVMTVIPISDEELKNRLRHFDMMH